jgi:phospholipid/cholesterol/gamma-HCH transport system substrate-binding protein
MSKLSTQWGRMKNTPGLLRDVILVTIVLALGAVATFTLFGFYKVTSPFDEQYEFSADFDMAPAVQLASRQEVRIAGVEVGKISGAEPTDEGRARLTFEIDPDQKVYQDARLVMRSKTPLNVMYVALDPGTSAAGELKKGGIIPMTQTERVIQPFEVLDQLDTRARSALTNLVNELDVALVDAPTQLPPGLTNVDQAAKSFTPAMKSLDQRRNNIRRIVTSLSLISSAAGKDDKRLAELVASLEQTLAVVADGDDALGASLEQLPGVTATLRSSMDSAAGLGEELTPVLEKLGAASAKLPGVLDNLNGTVDNLREIAKDARPVIAKARPVIEDLRPLVSDLRGAMDDLTPVAANLPQATARLVPWLDNLGAFVYNTSSSFSLGDVNGGLGRANLVLKVYDPTGGGSR